MALAFVPAPTAFAILFFVSILRLPMAFPNYNPDCSRETTRAKVVWFFFCVAGQDDELQKLLKLLKTAKTYPELEKS